VPSVSLVHQQNSSRLHGKKRSRVISIGFFCIHIKGHRARILCNMRSSGTVVHHDSCKILQVYANITHLDRQIHQLNHAVTFGSTSKHDVVHQPGDAADGVTRVDNFLEQFLFGCLLNDLLSNEA
jgi:hypothetical protein